MRSAPTHSLEEMAFRVNQSQGFAEQLGWGSFYEDMCKPEWETGLRQVQRWLHNGSRNPHLRGLLGKAVPRKQGKPGQEAEAAHVFLCSSQE